MAWATRVLTPRDLQLLFRVLECVDTLLQLRHGCRKSFSAVSNISGGYRPGPGGHRPALEPVEAFLELSIFGLEIVDHHGCRVVPSPRS